MKRREVGRGQVNGGGKDAADLQRRTHGDQKDQRLSIAHLTTKVQTKCIFHKTKVPIVRLCLISTKIDLQDFRFVSNKRKSRGQTIDKSGGHCV